MISLLFNIQFASILELVIVVLVAAYLLFSFLVVRQIGVLVNDVKTNLSGVVYVVGIINVILAVLALIASLALIV